MRARALVTIASLLGLGVLGSTFGACSASNPTNTFGGGGSGGAESAGTGNGTGTSNPSQADGTGGGDIVISVGTGGAGSGQGGSASCAGDASKGEQLPLDMYIMLDQSLSMSDEVSGGTKWSTVTAALKSFFGQASAAGISVGIQYFGLIPGGKSCSCVSNAQCPGSSCDLAFNGCKNCEDDDDSCDAADYAKPDVEIAVLPGVASALNASIDKHAPETLTPTSAALQGAVDHAKAWAMAHTGHVTIAVLATDGDPSECDDSLTHIDGIAATALAGNPSIKTFVIGVGDSLSALNGVAAAGGTSKAFIVDTSQNVNQQFLDALNAIRGTALGCTYKIPTPEAGTADFDLINVKYVPGSGGAAQTFPHVANQAACPANGNGWYYDDATNPQNILLCDSTCTEVKGDAKGEVDIVVGCKTIIN